jgi:hypothetical protein
MGWKWEDRRWEREDGSSKFLLIIPRLRDKKSSTINPVLSRLLQLLIINFSLLIKDTFPPIPLVNSF